MLKKGDRVKSKLTGRLDTIVLISGMKEYDNSLYVSKKSGFVLEM